MLAFFHILFQNLHLYFIPSLKHNLEKSLFTPICVYLEKDLFLDRILFATAKETPIWFVSRTFFLLNSVFVLRLPKIMECSTVLYPDLQAFTEHSLNYFWNKSGCYESDIPPPLPLPHLLWLIRTNLKNVVVAGKSKSFASDNKINIGKLVDFITNNPVLTWVRDNL